MIELYYANTGNAMRALLALEECGLEYRKNFLDLSQGEQKKSDFLKINPMGHVPAIIDTDAGSKEPLVLTQSGAILLYIAEKSGKFLPKDFLLKTQAIQTVFATVSDINALNRPIKYLMPHSQEPLAKKMSADFLTLQKAAFATMQKRLGDGEYLLGEFSVADIALYPIMHLKIDVLKDDPDFQLLMNWYQRMSERPAVQRTYNA